ncbi:MAG: PTS sugar transporter subunit IIB [Erysipelotrichaceae bacterium]|nr:PTS sugar transporter subunit IIB [Erysipelotrichaceae bacterium]
MKIVAICGCGMGSSVMLKINVQKVLADLGVEATVENSDLATGKAAAADADLILIGRELVDAIDLTGYNVIVLDNFINKNEIKERLEEYFKQEGK